MAASPEEVLRAPRPYLNFAHRAEEGQATGGGPGAEQVTVQTLAEMRTAPKAPKGVGEAAQHEEVSEVVEEPGSEPAPGLTEEPVPVFMGPEVNTSALSTVSGDAQSPGYSEGSTTGRSPLNDCPPDFASPGAPRPPVNSGNIGGSISPPVPKPLESPADEANAPATPQPETLPGTPAGLSSSPGSSPGVRATPPHPRPGEDGMPRGETLLHKLEMAEYQHQLNIIVPEGVGQDRKVQFCFKGKRHEVILPENASVGSYVPITLTRNPPLPKNSQTLQRGLYPYGHSIDKSSLIEQLKHGPRVLKDEENNLSHPVFTQRRELYHMLRGRCMDDMLGLVEEGSSESLADDREEREAALGGL